MGAMEEIVDEEISFFEQKCERLHLEIEKQSLQAVRSTCRSMRDSCIATYGWYISELEFEANRKLFIWREVKLMVLL